MPWRGLVPEQLFAMMASEGFRKTARMYRAVTRQIDITNAGNETVQLQTRHWIITDATGHQENVRGEGVIGEQPVLAPGERFEYTSGVPLPTASGFMTGRYQMVSESGERFEIDVPTFSLVSPDCKRVLN